MSKSISEKLDAIAKESLEHFIPECRDAEHELEGLGISIAGYCDWNGIKICNIFAEALEDANFHTEAGIVFDWMENLKAGKANHG